MVAGEGPPNKYIPQYDSRLNLGLFTARNVEDLRAYRMAGSLSFVAENIFEGGVKSGDRVGAIRPRRSCCISQILHPSGSFEVRKKYDDARESSLQSIHHLGSLPVHSGENQNLKH